MESFVESFDKQASKKMQMFWVADMKNTFIWIKIIFIVTIAIFIVILVLERIDALKKFHMGRRGVAYAKSLSNGCITKGYGYKNALL